MKELPSAAPIQKDVRVEYPRYFALFEGQETKLSDIQKECPQMEIAINTLEKLGFLGRRQEGEEVILFPKPNDTIRERDIAISG